MSEQKFAAWDALEIILNTQKKYLNTKKKKIVSRIPC